MNKEFSKFIRSFNLRLRLKYSYKGFISSLHEDNIDLKTFDDFVENIAKPLPLNSPLILNTH